VLVEVYFITKICLDLSVKILAELIVFLQKDLTLVRVGTKADGLTLFLAFVLENVRELE
jgi:hypothetical protein